MASSPDARSSDLSWLDDVRDEVLAAVERHTDLDSRLADLVAEIERRGLCTAAAERNAGDRRRPAGQA
jgi:hypothetical protein